MPLIPLRVHLLLDDEQTEIKRKREIRIQTKGFFASFFFFSLNLKATCDGAHLFTPNWTIKKKRRI